MTHRDHASINTPCLWAVWCYSLCRGMPLPAKPPLLQLVVMAGLQRLGSKKPSLLFKIQIHQNVTSLLHVNDVSLFADMSKKEPAFLIITYSANKFRTNDLSCSVGPRSSHKHIIICIISFNFCPKSLCSFKLYSSWFTWAWCACVMHLKLYDGHEQRVANGVASLVGRCGGQ